MVIGILVLVAMAIFVALMVSRRLATVLALIFLAVVIALLVRVPIGGKAGILAGIVSKGAVLLAPTMLAVILGGWLGCVMDDTGIAATLVRKAVELGGDRPYVVAFGVFVVSLLVSTVASSAAAAMLVGLIGIPAMLALGIPPVVAASVIVLGQGAGIPLQLATWQYLSQVLNLNVSAVQSFELHLFPIAVIGGILFLFVQSKVAGTVHSWGAFADEFGSGASTAESRGTAIGVDGGSANDKASQKQAPWYALVTPLIPVVLVLGLKVDIIPALLIGILYGVLTTKPRQFNSTLLRSAYRGLEVSGPAVFLFIAIGILLTAVRSPSLIPALRPIITSITPQGAILFAIVFAVLGPLCLYRGPLNIYGMGVGIAGVLLALHVYPALAVLGIMASIGEILAVSDPTSTQVVWSAEYAGVSAERVMTRTLAYTWLISAAGVVLTTLLFLK